MVENNLRNPPGCHAHWPGESEEFDLVIQHRPGASKPLQMHCPVCLRFSLLEFKNCQKSDPVLGILINDLNRDTKNVNNLAVHGWSGKHDFLTLGKEDGLLYLCCKVGKC